ncbi:hypothetical protein GE09DRAFT_1067802 [Coniochaeta sp. 2T2.1]|nr:hypothetical protein GE09DRAFT_1067802 [Coniochaeta sp. 2T2.1]
MSPPPGSINPPGYVGNVCGTRDQISLVYETGGSVHALILVSFGPGTYLSGVKYFDDRSFDDGPKEELGRKLKEIQAILASNNGAGKEDPRGEAQKALRDRLAVVV